MRNLLSTLSLFVGAGFVGCSESNGESAQAGSGGQHAGSGSEPSGGALTGGTGGAGQAGTVSGSGGTPSAGGAGMGGASTGGAPTGGAQTGGTAGAMSTGGMPSGGAAGAMSTGGASGSGGSSGGSGGAGGRACPAVTPDACSAADKTICANEVATHCGLTYEFWRDTGGGCMVAKADGFSIEWGEENNVLARKGVRPGTGDEVFTYEAAYTANGTSFMGVYGWMQDPLIEYYIVDSWGGARPPGSRGEHLGSSEIDGGVYEQYRTQQVDKPSIDPNVTTFYQYWSVRTSKRSCGTINVARHFYVWELSYLELGRLYEVSFVVEGYLSSGSGDVRLSVD